MSDAGDEIQVDAPAEVEVAAEAPKGKLSVEDALQVRPFNIHDSRPSRPFIPFSTLYSKS